MTGGPATVVWAGRGASYSWAWWAEPLEALGWFDVSFPRDTASLMAALPASSLMLVGGGDVAALRAAVDWDAVGAWLRGGGRLVATCAGAYLLRGWAGVGIANAVRDVPAGVPTRAWSSCSEGTVLHPVRGPVRLLTDEGGTIGSHLYGGPVLGEPRDGRTQVAARYSGAAAGAEWLLPDLAPLLDGTPAVVASRVGDGLLVLSGPHLEHPACPDAHGWLGRLLGEAPAGAPDVVPWDGPDDPGGMGVVRDLIAVRNLASSLEGVTWMSGDKVWSAQRVAGFADALVARAAALARWGRGQREGGDAPVVRLSGAASALAGDMDAAAWDAVFEALSGAGSSILGAYFVARRAGMPEPAPRPPRPPRLAAPVARDVEASSLAAAAGARGVALP